MLGVQGRMQNIRMTRPFIDTTRKNEGIHIMIVTNCKFFGQQMSYSCCINLTHNEQIFSSFHRSSI